MNNIYPVYIKRLVDIIVSFTALFILSPIITIISVILFISNAGRPFFFQDRPGRNAHIFRAIKFKTMNDNKDIDGALLPDRKRLTKIGSFIRRTSLDELPQLFNVLKGDMSLIGPRPLLIKYLPYYSLEEQKRHHVRPGITGLAQVNGRNNLSWDKRLALDVYYVENLSLIMDLKILLMTIRNVFFARDINIVPGEKMKNLDEERRV